MSTLSINLHYRRKQEQTAKKGILTSPFKVDVTFLQDISLSTDSTKKLPFSSFKTNLLPDLEVYAFKDTIVDKGTYVLANIHVPNFFKETDPSQTGITGLFLVSLGDGLDNIFDNSCKAVGRYGCPTRVVMATAKPSFSFAGMNFYPIMMRDMSVAFYVCDEDSKKYDWKLKHGTDFEKLFAVALDQPVSFDPTLGIYLTRGADLVAI